MIKFGLRQSFNSIEDERFRTWGKEIADFARMLGVKATTLHHNNINKDKGVQKKALKNLEDLESLTKERYIKNGGCNV